AGNIPNKQGTNLQTKSGMMHTVHSTSVGMHGSSCECPECQKQSAQQLRQSNQNFLFDASNNNTPNNGAIQQPNLSENQMRRDFCEAGESTNRPMKGGDIHSFVQDPREQQQHRDFCVNHSVSNAPHNINQNFGNTNFQNSAHLTNYSHSNRPMNSGVKMVQQQTKSAEKANDSVHQSLIEQCDKQNARYSGNSLYQLTDYSLNNRPNHECRESVGKFGSACETPVLKLGNQTAKELLANADNNNRPNTNCYERLQQVDLSGATALHKSVDDSVTESLSHLRQVLNNIGAEISQVKQQSDRVR
ncbi:MAG: hypothetical protein GY820_01225, partial [Gammaproteobacteria bacterium]|nr:hypothetical protein [Gammaproteobacteria bacterium]